MLSRTTLRFFFEQTLTGQAEASCRDSSNVEPVLTGQGTGADRQQQRRHRRRHQRLHQDLSNMCQVNIRKAWVCRTADCDHIIFRQHCLVPADPRRYMFLEAYQCQGGKMKCFIINEAAPRDVPWKASEYCRDCRTRLGLSSRYER